MSYDFYIEVDTGDPEPHWIEPYFADTHPAFEDDGMAGTAVVTGQGYARCGNYTSNVSGMWADCLTAAMQTVKDCGDYGAEDGRLRLCDLHGWRCGDIAALLAAAVKWGVEHIEELREKNPENGWGNAEGAVTYLWDIWRFCEAHPNGRLRISS